MPKKIAVISDIHGNVFSLRNALNEIDSVGVDLTVFLGDLLTYGCQPVEVVNELLAYASESTSIFVKGNHDQFYFDFLHTDNIFSYKVPDFVKESVSWTNKQLKQFDVNLEELFPWVDQNYGVAVFGHTHRQFIARHSPAEGLFDISSANSETYSFSDTVIINPGSIGQPRGRGASYLLLEYSNNERFTATLNSVDVEEELSSDGVLASSLSESTKSKLISYVRS